MIKSFKENMVMLPKALEMTPEQKKGKIVCGVFKDDNEKTEFCDEYQRMVDMLKGRNA